VVKQRSHQPLLGSDFKLEEIVDETLNEPVYVEDFQEVDTPVFVELKEGFDEPAVESNDPQYVIDDNEPVEQPEKDQEEPVEPKVPK
jgi:hypothetical protein